MRARILSVFGDFVKCKVGWAYGLKAYQGDEGLPGALQALKPLDSSLRWNDGRIIEDDGH